VAVRPIVLPLSVIGRPSGIDQLPEAHNARTTRAPAPLMTTQSGDAEYWRKRANEARREADRIHNFWSKQLILNVAYTYERRAEQAEKKKPPDDEQSG
jgi:hypothetical protein